MRPELDIVALNHLLGRRAEKEVLVLVVESDHA